MVGSGSGYVKNVPEFAKFGKTLLMSYLGSKKGCQGKNFLLETDKSYSVILYKKSYNF